MCPGTIRKKAEVEATHDNTTEGQDVLVKAALGGMAGVLEQLH